MNQLAVQKHKASVTLNVHSRNILCMYIEVEDTPQEWKPYSSSPEESNDPSVDVFLACDKKKSKDNVIIIPPDIGLLSLKWLC